MPQVVLDGHDLGDITDVGQLAYYRREPGAVVDGEPVPVAATEAELNADEPAEGDLTEGDEQPQWPGKSASKAEKYEYAQTVDSRLPEYDDITVADLDERYGGGE